MNKGKFDITGLTNDVHYDNKRDGLFRGLF